MADEHIRLMHKFYSRQDLPPEVEKVRGEAFSWAHCVAADSCGRARATAVKHYSWFVLYHPPHLLNTSVWRTALPRILPRPIFSMLRWGWHTARRTLAPVLRLSKRGL